jgi:selenide, water dikinase
MAEAPTWNRENPGDEVDLLQMSPAAGCGCKLPWDQLNGLMANIDHLISSSGRATNAQSPTNAREDAAFFELSSGTLLASSVDFGTPVSASPSVWGRIAALNAVSDLYAIGATPHFALSIVAWPARLSTDTIADITRSAVEALSECSAILAGGHTITSDVPLFGLAVTGSVDRAKIMLMSNARPGQVLILTKPIGTGIVTAAQKAGLASPDAIRNAEGIMTTSNRVAAELAVAAGIDAATDVTGYGLIGHLNNMLVASRNSAELYATQVPMIDEVLDLVSEHGIVPNSAERVYFGVESDLDWTTVPLEKRLVMCDPQTSGGLLLAASDAAADVFLSSCRGRNQLASVIGRITEGQVGKIQLMQ